MEQSSAKRVLRLQKDVCDTCEERAVDLELVLPDYIPEVAAVLKCTLHPVVNARYRSGDRYTVSGCVTVRILYLSDDRTQVHCYEASQPFSAAFDAGHAVHHSVQLKTNYVHARAVSPRRVDVHGAFRVCLKAIGAGEQAVLAPTGERDVYCQTKTMSYSVPFCEADKTFTVSESVEFKAPVDRLVYAQASVLSREFKPLVNKMILKGVLQIKTLAVTQGQCVTAHHEIPFSQIIDVEGLCETRHCRVEVFVCEQEFRMQQTERGDTSCLFDGKLYAVVQCFEHCEEDVVLDAYSVDKPILCETAVVPFVKHTGRAHTPCELRCTVDMPEGITECLDVEADVKSVRADGGALNVCIAVTFIAKDMHGAYCCYERTTDLEELFDGTADGMLIRKVEWVVQGSCLRLQLQTDILSENGEWHTENVVTDTVAEHQSPFVKTGAALRIVYAEEGDNVWDIAKKNHACVQDILAENDLNDVTIKSPTMLMIPML